MIMKNLPEPNSKILGKVVFNISHIPELIGPTQYRRLLTAMGVDERETPTGEEFASLVAGKAAGEERRRKASMVDHWYFQNGKVDFSSVPDRGET